MFIFPSRSKASQRLISHDIHSNTYNYKSTFSVEIVPVCKVQSSRWTVSVGTWIPYRVLLWPLLCRGSSGYQDNVVCLSPRLAQSLGNMGQVCVCVRVTSTIHLIDPSTLQSECFYSITDWLILCCRWRLFPYLCLIFLKCFEAFNLLSS